MPPLTRHPDTPCQAVRALDAAASRPRPGALELRYRLAADLDGLAIPPPAPAPERADGLWRHLCFEAFVHGPAGPGYLELNFAPSHRWAAYRFDGYRQGMAPAAVAGLQVETTRTPGALELVARLELDGAPQGPWRLALTAVVEERGGRISYWSLRHPAGRPDFHSADCLALELPAPLSP